MNLYLLNENVTNGFHSSALQYITITAILCGIFVIISRNPIVSVLFLIGLFLSVSIYLMMLGINFIGLSYLLVYVGAVSILFLFILMLINIRISEITSSTSNSIPLAIIIGTLFISAVYQALPLSLSYNNNGYNTILPGFTLIKDDIKKSFSVAQDTDSTTLYSFLFGSSNLSTSKPLSFLQTYSNDSVKQQNLDFISSQTWDTMLAEASHITTLGNILYTSFPLWILLTSLILLLAMVGAIVITLRN